MAGKPGKGAGEGGVWGWRGAGWPQTVPFKESKPSQLVPGELQPVQGGSPRPRADPSSRGGCPVVVPPPPMCVCPHHGTPPSAFPEGDMSTFGTGAAEPGRPRRAGGGHTRGRHGGPPGSAAAAPSLRGAGPGSSRGGDGARRAAGTACLGGRQARNGTLASYCPPTVHLGTICAPPPPHPSIHPYTRTPPPLTKRLSNRNLLWQPAGINAIKRVFNGLIDWSRYHV